MNTNNNIQKPVEMVDLTDFFTTLWSRKIFISVSIFIGILGSIVYLSVVKPVYTVNASLEMIKAGNSQLALFDNTKAVLEKFSFISTELEILYSNSIIEETVDKLNLDLDIEIVGDSDIAITDIKLPNELLSQPLVLEINQDFSFTLSASDGTVIKGTLQEREEWQNPFLSYEENGLYILMPKFEASSEQVLTFKLTALPVETVVQRVKSNLSVFEAGRASGILSVSYKDIDPVLAAKVLNTILETYIERGIDRSAQQARQTLEYLDKQVPSLLDSLNEAENQLTAFQIKNDSIDFDAEIVSILDEKQNTRDKILSLKQKRTSLRRQFKAEHPTVRTIDRQIYLVEAEFKRLDNMLELLPTLKKEYLRLQREVTIKNDLYRKIMRTVQELKWIEKSRVGNARIVDYAYHSLHSKTPKTKLVIVMGGVLGLFFSIMLIYLKRFVEGDITSVEKLESKFSIPVLANLTSNTKLIGFRKAPKELGSSLDDSYREYFNVLRINLDNYIKDFDTPHNIIAFSSADYGAGKAFSLSNLAKSYARTGKSVLVIDADINNGNIASIFSVADTPGTAELVKSGLGVSSSDFIQDTSVDRLSVIPKGSPDAISNQLMFNDSLKRHIETIKDQFDFIFINTPPFFATANSLTVNQISDVTLFVLKKKQHSISDFQKIYRDFEVSGVSIDALVFNDLGELKEKK